MGKEAVQHSHAYARTPITLPPTALPGVGSATTKAHADWDPCQGPGWALGRWTCDPRLACCSPVAKRECWLTICSIPWSVPRTQPDIAVALCYIGRCVQPRGVNRHPSLRLIGSSQQSTGSSWLSAQEGIMHFCKWPKVLEWQFSVGLVAVSAERCLKHAAFCLL